MEENPELALREDNILELYNNVTKEFIQLNLNTIHIILLVKNSKTVSISINGIKSIETVPVNYYEGLVEILKQSKLYEVHKQNYYAYVQIPGKDNKTVQEKQHIDDIFVNIKSENIMSCTEIPGVQEVDPTERLVVDVVEKGTLVFNKEEN